MTVEMLERAIASTKTVLANVSPDQLDDLTPCQSWKVRDLINHFVGGTYFFAAVAKTGKPPAGDGGERDFTEGDLNATYAAGAAEAAGAFKAPGVMEKTMKLPFGELPGSAFVMIAATDEFVHGWDLARATGQPTASLDPELAEQLLGFGQDAVPDQFRGSDGTAPFGPKVDVPDTAPAADRLAGFLGRHV
jgi:uncharacterized protein (TIGR03086 family)